MAFRELLKVDGTCIDAAQELMAVQILQLMVRECYFFLLQLLCSHFHCVLTLFLSALLFSLASECIATPSLLHV